MKITCELGLTERERARLDLHSFLNVLTILHEELAAVRLDLGQSQALAETSKLVEAALAAVHAGSMDTEGALQLLSINFYFSREVELAISQTLERRPGVDETLANVSSILNVLAVRLHEYFERRRTGLNWIPHPIDRLTANFHKFFAAVEKNSHGRYHIVFNATDKGPNDYLVHLKIAGPNLSHHLLMPAVMQDVFRDLIANARKYTHPGGKITASLVQGGGTLNLVVEDNGSGIVPEDIEHTVEFGFRSAATRSVGTKGGGFGLTKAYAITRELGGAMDIESEIGKGTRISISIPVPSATGTLAATQA